MPRKSLDARLNELEEKLAGKKLLIIMFRSFRGDPRTQAELTAPLNKEGFAWVSRWWSVKITGGNAVSRAEALAELRQDKENQMEPTSEFVNRMWDESLARIGEQGRFKVEPEQGSGTRTGTIPRNEQEEDA